jgi:mannonate dehydratase
MHVGHQYCGTSRAELEFVARHGVTHIDCSLAADNSNPDGPALSEANLRDAMAACVAAGVSLEMVHVELPRSIIRGDPARERDVQEVREWIATAGRCGLRGLNYNFGILDGDDLMAISGHHPLPGRGGTTYNAWRIDASNVGPGNRLAEGGVAAPVDHTTLGKAGAVPRAEAFTRIKWFLDQVIPAAEEWKVQLACHPEDPPAPRLRGVENWDYPMHAGLHAFCDLSDSAYHGLNLCLGTAAEGFEDPARELPGLVRSLGLRKKIFNIHFRNIRGGLLDWYEVYPDEGDVDMFEVATALHETGYEHMLMPDHAPSHPADGAGEVEQNWANWPFQWGFIIAVIQGVKKTSGASWAAVRTPSAKL